MIPHPCTTGHGNEVRGQNCKQSFYAGNVRVGSCVTSIAGPRGEAPNLPAFNFRITDELNLGQGSETEKFNDKIAAITSLRHRACEPPRQSEATAE